MDELWQSTDPLGRKWGRWVCSTQVQEGLLEGSDPEGRVAGDERAGHPRLKEVWAKVQRQETAGGL